MPPGWERLVSDSERLRSAEMSLQAAPGPTFTRSNNHFIQRLRSIHDLTIDDENALLRSLGAPRVVARGEDVIPEGSATNSAAVIVNGIACQYKVLNAGDRQILAFNLPGDLVNFVSTEFERSGTGVEALSSCTVRSFPLICFRKLASSNPNAARALWHYACVQSSIMQMWLANSGRQSALQRLSHLICEQFVRLNAVGLAEIGRQIEMRVTQSTWADATGLSVVHVNRTLQILRSRGLITIDASGFKIGDWLGLQDVAGFDPSYLHIKFPAEPPEIQLPTTPHLYRI